jgi:hypothetical protein
VCLVGAGAITTFAAGAWTAVATTTSSKKPIAACEEKKTKVLHLGKCAHGEKQITWNRTGHAGSPGSRGKAGPRGVAGPSGPQGSPGIDDIWQVLMNADGSVLYAHTGITAQRNGTGSYTVSWTGLTGGGIPYCYDINGPALTVQDAFTASSGAGYITFSTGSSDENSVCEIVGISN